MVMADSLALTDEFSLWIYDSAHIQLTDNVNQTRTAQANGLGSRLTHYFVSGLHRLFIYGAGLNGTVCGTHSAADITALEGWSGRTSTAHHEVRISEHQLSIGTQINEQRELRTIPDHADQRTCRDVSAHITSDIRSNNNMGIWINVNSNI